jgi:hypothetical protein
MPRRKSSAERRGVSLVARWTAGRKTIAHAITRMARKTKVKELFPKL